MLEEEKSIHIAQIVRDTSDPPPERAVWKYGLFLWKNSLYGLLSLVLWNENSFFYDPKAF
jgi:hypothetical protein